MDGNTLKKTEIGLSIYPDFLSLIEIEKEVSKAHDFGYTRIFTSIQLGDLGFMNAKDGLSDKYLYLFELCKKFDLKCHADINKRVFTKLGIDLNDLTELTKLGISVLRLDGGFNNEEIAQLTLNEQGISIEDNTSMVKGVIERLEVIKKQGNLNNYMACHNFFPRNETGISLKDALDMAKAFTTYGCKNGIFITSQTNKPHLNETGNGVCTIERHRYTPANIAFDELRAYNVFDFIFFGDSCPDIEYVKLIGKSNQNQYIEVPIWYYPNVSDDMKKNIEETLCLSRPDQAEFILRITQTRTEKIIPKQNTFQRNCFSVTQDNINSNRYQGEIGIMLKDLDATNIANVIGQIPDVAKYLIEPLKYSGVHFKFKNYANCL